MLCYGCKKIIKTVLVRSKAVQTAEVNEKGEIEHYESDTELEETTGIYCAKCNFNLTNVVTE